MQRLKDRLDSTTWKKYDTALLWSAFTLVWCGYLRVSEYASPSPKVFNVNRTLRCCDVEVTPDQVSVLLRASKTDQFGHGYRLQLSATENQICPVKAMRDFWQLRKELQHHRKPLFMFQDGSYLTSKIVDDTLNHLLQGERKIHKPFSADWSSHYCCSQKHSAGGDPESRKMEVRQSHRLRSSYRSDRRTEPVYERLIYLGQFCCEDCGWK